MLNRFLPACLGGSKKNNDHVNLMKTTQLYDSQIGKILISWSHLLAGLFLSIEIPLSHTSSWSYSFIRSFQDKQDPFFCLKIYPDQKKGFRRFRTMKGIMEFAWDFTKAEFYASRDAQPKSGYFFCITINGEMVLLLGDLKEEAYYLTKAQKPSEVAFLISREDVVDMMDNCKYSTDVKIGDDESIASLSILHGNDVAMKVCVGKKKLIDVKSIWNEMRGSKKLVSKEESIEISWNRLDWVPPKMKAKKKKKIEPKKDEMMSGDASLPAVVVDFTYTRKGGKAKHLSFAIKLRGS